MSPVGPRLSCDNGDDGTMVMVMVMSLTSYRNIISHINSKTVSPQSVKTQSKILQLS